MNFELTIADINSILPNTFVAGRGEISILDKIKGYISQAWSFVHSELIPEYLIPDTSVGTRYIASTGATPASTDSIQDIRVLEAIKKIVVSYALYLAIPALDISLSSTGFAVGSTDSLAPASASRVKELRESLSRVRDAEIAVMQSRLMSFPAWTATVQAQKFMASLMSMYDFRSSGDPALSYSAYLDAQKLLVRFEDMISGRFMSYPLMSRLRKYHLQNQLSIVGDSTDASGDKSPSTNDQQPKTKDQNSKFNIQNSKLSRVVLRLLAIEHKILEDQDYDPNAALFAIVEYIRRHPEAFPEWHNSQVASLFGRAPFLNQKRSGGYFF